MTALAAQVDPSTLSSQQQRAIKLVKEHRLYRRPNGYGQFPANVRLDVMRSLQGLGLVRLYGDCPVLTGSGLNVHAVMEERRKGGRS